MRRTTVRVAILVGLVLVGVAAGFAVSTLARGEDTGQAGPSTPAASSSSESSAAAEPPSQAVLDAIAALERSREEIAAQAEPEIEAATAVLTMPAGTEFGPVYALERIDTQIEWPSGEHGEEMLASGAIEPADQWFEEGLFASVMAIDWICAWLSTGVAAVEAGDDDAVADAVATLHSFTETDLVDAFLDYEDELRRVADPLLDGDTTAALDYLPSCEDSTRVDD